MVMPLSTRGLRGPLGAMAGGASTTTIAGGASTTTIAGGAATATITGESLLRAMT